MLAGDTHGHLLIFNAANGMLIRSIDTGGALNSGLISYSVRGVQYVAANVGGPTQNPAGEGRPGRDRPGRDRRNVTVTSMILSDQ